MQHPQNYHSAKLSVFQSAINEVLHKKGEGQNGLRADHPMIKATNRILDAIDKGDELVTRSGCLGQIAGFFDKAKPFEVCAKLGFELALARVEGNQSKIDQLENEFKDNICDPGWAEALAKYVEYYVVEEKQAMYYDDKGNTNNYVYSLPQGKKPGELTIGLLGDWGTGESVAEIVLNELFRHELDLVLHVGDIYYAGTPHEANVNFMNILNKARKQQPVPIYNLPGNHDYYSGGKGFYGILPELNKPPFAPAGTPTQEASFFCLRNEHWQLQGMDTGYYDHDLFKVGEDITHLHPSEANWHRNKLETAGDRRVMLFSHHQFFSAFTSIGNSYFNQSLQNDFKDYLDGKISAWFWGHEHLLEIYDEFLGLPKGRCIGHSAFPVLTTDNPYQVKNSQVPLVSNPKHPDSFIELGTSDKVYNHGYAVMTLKEKEAEVNYYEIAGDGSSTKSTLQYSETI